MTTSLSQTLSRITKTLASTSPTARVDAETVLMHVTGLTRAGLVTHGDAPLFPEQQRQIEELAHRRARGEPVAYLTGRREFWSLSLRVTPATLVPRPETELLVELALARVPSGSTATIADLGTGSGAVALALAHERPHARVVATDNSTAALAVARTNAAHLGLANVEFRHGDWAVALSDTMADLIVSNPPYVREADPHLLEGDVRFEPRSALTAGVDGLDAIRVIAAAAPGRLHSGGWLLMEHGFDQGEAVRALLREKGYLDVRSFRDLAGQDRVTGGCRP